MKKEYIFIVSVLILLLTVIMAHETLSREAREWRKALNEEEAYRHELYEKKLEIEKQFNEMVIYCKEHEEDLMKVSEVFLEQYYEDITPQETAEIAQNNISLEWMELSEKLTLEYPTDSNRKYVRYLCAKGGTCLLYVVYFNADDAVYKFDINGHQWGRDEKINDNLYVCIFEFQLV